MPAPTRTWTLSWNNAPTTQTTVQDQTREILRVFKNNMVSAGWTVEGSSDSVAAGMDSTDRWDSDTDLVWNSGGSAHSWLVLSSPSGYPSASKTLYWTIALSTGASNQHLVNFSIATAIPTGGSTTADPSQPSNSRTFTNKQIVPATVANVSYHMGRNTDGDWFHFVSEDGVGYAAFGWHTLEAINGDSGVNYPCHSLCSYNDASPGAALETQWRNISHSAMWWQDDSVYVTTNDYGVLWPDLGGQVFAGQMDSNGSDISTEYFDLPVILASRETNEVGVFGVLTDIGIGPSGSGVAQASEIPTGTSSRTLIGEFWYPNGGTTPVF